VFVLKVGGAICGDPPALNEVADQVGLLREVGIRVVWVHGGGPQTTDLANRLGVETTMVDGRRVTSPETLEIAIMTMNGSVNTALLSACRQAGVNAVGMSGLDAGLVVARKRPPVTRQGAQGAETVDYGRVGDIVRVDTSSLNRMLDLGFVPVVSPLCADESGQVLNVNADTVASRLAQALGAEKLILLTDTAGLLDDKNDNRTLVSLTDIRGLDEMQAGGAIDAGMLPKAKAAREALQGGVHRVHLVGWKTPGSLLVEVFTNEGSGTLIVRDRAELLGEEQAVR
jgi:acetylglutamate kinase